MFGLQVTHQRIGKPNRCNQCGDSTPRTVQIWRETPLMTAKEWKEEPAAERSRIGRRNAVAASEPSERVSAASTVITQHISVELVLLSNAVLSVVCVRANA
jgi:hypothetical protein